MSDHDAIDALMRAWDPPLADYLAAPAVSSGAVTAVDRGGLPEWRRHLTARRRETRQMRLGTMLGSWLCGESTPEESFALRRHLLDDVELQAESAWRAFERSRSPAARQVQGLLAREKWPEVSAVFVPLDPDDDEPLAPCKARQDIIVRPFDAFAGVQIKATELPLRQFWPWEWRRRHLVSAAFYREWSCNLFGGYVEEYLIVQRIVPPYEIGFFHLTPTEASRRGEPSAELLADAWLNRCVPALRELRGAAMGDHYSREEQGI